MLRGVPKSFHQLILRSLKVNDVHAFMTLQASETKLPYARQRDVFNFTIILL
jgi:hypothetical protein